MDANSLQSGSVLDAIQHFDIADASKKAIKLGALKESRSNDFYKSQGFVFTESGEWDNYYIRLPK